MDFSEIDSLVDSELKKTEQIKQEGIKILDANFDEMYKEHHQNFATQMAGKAVGGVADFWGKPCESQVGQSVYDSVADKEDQKALQEHRQWQKIYADYDDRKMRHRNMVEFHSIDPNSKTPSLVDWSKEYRSQFKFGDYENAVDEAYRRSIEALPAGSSLNGLEPKDWPTSPNDIMDEDFNDTIVAKESPAVARRYQVLRDKQRDQRQASPGMGRPCRKLVGRCSPLRGRADVSFGGAERQQSCYSSCR